MFHQRRMLRSTAEVPPALTHGARWRGRFASGQVSKRGDGGGVRWRGGLGWPVLPGADLSPSGHAREGEISPRGGKRKRGKRRDGEWVFRKGKHLLSCLINLFFFGFHFFAGLYRIHLHHSFSFLLHPKAGLFPFFQHVSPSSIFSFFFLLIPGRWKCSRNCWPTRKKKKNSHIPGEVG